MLGLEQLGVQNLLMIAALGGLVTVAVWCFAAGLVCGKSLTD